MLKTTNFNSIFDDFREMHIAVVGDVMVDSYFKGKVDRISPEAPVPVVQVREKSHKAGGAANVALNLRSMESKVTLYSVRGNDVEGEMLTEMMDNEGINTDCVFLDYDRRTTIKTRVIGNNQQVLRIDEEDTLPISKETEDKIISCFKSEIKQYNAVVIEDYNKGLLTPRLISSLIKTALDSGVPIVVDPKKENFFEYKNTSLFKPNRKELIEGLGLDNDLTEPDDIRDAILRVAEILSPKYVMLTLSEDGVVIYDGSHFEFIPAHARKIYDVSGAGDTVISIAALCLAADLGPEVIAELSNLAGGLVCEKPGVVPIERDLLLSEVLSIV